MEKWECGIRVRPFDAKQLDVISDSEAFTSDSSASLAAFEAAKLEPEKPEIGMDISIVSPEILNINFSKQMLSTLLKTAKSWTEEAKKEGFDADDSDVLENKLTKKVNIVNCYSIRNLTGFNLYWTSHKDARGAEQGGGEGEEIVVSVLPDNEEQSLGENFKRLSRRVSMNSKQVVDTYVVSMELEFFLAHQIPASASCFHFSFLSPFLIFYLSSYGRTN